MTNQQGAPEAPKVRTADYEAGWKDGYKQGAWAPQQPAKAESLRQILTDPENQPNQYGVEFGMSGQQMHFKIGNQLFRLAYEPDDQQEFEFMKRMLIHAFSTFTPDVKMAQHPATHVQNPAEIEHVAGDVSKNGAESDMAPQPSPTAQADSQPAPEYVGNGMFKGETIEKAAEHWANWCDRRCMTGLSEFLRVVAARAPAESVTAPAGPSKSLPYEPTSAMLIAARERDPALPIETVRAIYWSMWRTAPTPPAQAADGVLEDAALLKEARGALWQPANAALCERIDAYLDAARKEGANHD